jgi:hypothetical protein
VVSQHRRALFEGTLGPVFERQRIFPAMLCGARHMPAPSVDRIQSQDPGILLLSAVYRCQEYRKAKCLQSSKGQFRIKWLRRRQRRADIVHGDAVALSKGQRGRKRGGGETEGEREGEGKGEQEIKMAGTMWAQVHSVRMPWQWQPLMFTLIQIHHADPRNKTCEGNVSSSR